MNIVKQLRQQTGTTQQELAAMGGTSQSTIATYEKGAKSPTVHTIEKLARSQGLEILVTYIPLMSREDRRSLAFHQAIAKRLREEPEAILRRARVNLEKLTSLHSGAQVLFEQWSIWLELPLETLIEKILEPLPEAREMRQVSPFSGVLSTKERARILHEFRQESRN